MGTRLLRLVVSPAPVIAQVIMTSLFIVKTPHNIKKMKFNSSDVYLLLTRLVTFELGIALFNERLDTFTGVFG